MHSNHFKTNKFLISQFKIYNTTEKRIKNNVINLKRVKKTKLPVYRSNF